MDGRRLRFLLALAAFLTWTGWLIYQAATSADPIVVSRPQVFLSPIVVEAAVPEGGGTREVVVHHVYRGQAFLSPRARLTVVHFDQVRGWQGPGDYLLCLHQDREGADATYAVSAIPVSPGFPPVGQLERQQPVIYPSTPATRAQLLDALRLSDPPDLGEVR